MVISLGLIIVGMWVQT